MKFTTVLFLAFAFAFSGLHAQAKKASLKKEQSRYPESFTISRADFDSFFSYKANEAMKTPGNKYIDKSVLQLNSLNGDMRLLRIRLSYFTKSTMMVQVNGEYSTQVFILSDDKTLAYKGRFEKEQVTLTKCRRDEIISE